jgi:ubiquinone biosynthesis protein
MAIGDRLSRYTDFAKFLAKYGRTDVRASVDAADAEQFVRDVETLGPTFIKLGQLLSTRADLLPPAYVDALARLQDKVEPFPFDEVAAIVEVELAARLS